jgi:hypothetical protein
MSNYLTKNNNYEKILKDIQSSEDYLEKIFFITVGPDVKTYKDLEKLSSTKKWYLFSQLDKFISKQLDKKVMNSFFSQLKTQYQFPEEMLMYFSGYNYNNTNGYRSNYYGLNPNNLKPEIRDIISKNIIAREKLINSIQNFGINLNTLNQNVNIQEVAKQLESSISSEQKEKILKLLTERGNAKNINPKEIIDIIAIKK